MISKDLHSIYPGPKCLKNFHFRITIHAIFYIFSIALKMHRSTQNASILVFGPQLLDSIDLGVFNCANWNLCNNNVFLKHWTPGLWSFSPRPLHLNKYKSTYHNAYIIINSKYCRISIGSWEEILEKGNTYFHSLKTLSPWRMNFTGTNLNLLFLIKTSKVPCNWEQF